MAFGQDGEEARNYKYGLKPPVLGCDEVARQCWRAHEWTNRLVAIELERRRLAREVVLPTHPEWRDVLEKIGKLQEEKRAIEVQIRKQNCEASAKFQGTPEQKKAINEIKNKLAPLYKEEGTVRNAAYQDHRLRRKLAKIDRWEAMKRRWAAAEVDELTHEYAYYWGWLNVLTDTDMKDRRSGRPPKFRRNDGNISLAFQINDGKKGEPRGLTQEQLWSGKSDKVQIMALGEPGPDGKPAPDGTPWPEGTPVPDTTGKRAFKAMLRLKVHSGTQGKAVTKVGKRKPNGRPANKPKGRPVWATFMIYWHRPFPEGARAKYVRLLRTQRGRHTHWEVLFSVAKEEWTKVRPPGELGLGMDMGWRLIEEVINGRVTEKKALRVAFWVGTDGAKGEIVIPAAHLDMWHRAEELDSQRRLEFNEAKRKLHEDIKYLINIGTCPGWLACLEKSVPRWERYENLHALLHQWLDVSGEYRFHGDERLIGRPPTFRKVEEPMPRHPRDARSQNMNKRTPPTKKTRLRREQVSMGHGLLKWAYYDRHLEQEALDIRAKAIRRRNHMYRTAVRRLANKYRLAVAEEIDWKKLQSKAEASADQEVNRTNARIAALGTLRRYLQEAMYSSVLRDPAYTSKTCYKCGQRTRFKVKSALMQTCEHCKAVWDRDECAGHNMANTALDILEGRTTIEAVAEAAKREKEKEEETEAAHTGFDAGLGETSHATPVNPTPGNKPQPKPSRPLPTKPPPPAGKPQPKPSPRPPRGS